MENDLAILSSAKYDMDVRFPAMRATRRSKRTLHAALLSRQHDLLLTTMDRAPDVLSAVELMPLMNADTVGPPHKARKLPRRMAKGCVKTVQAPVNDDNDEEVTVGRKRMRGRPRINVKDETAADVRCLLDWVGCLFVSPLTAKTCCRDDGPRFGWRSGPTAIVKSRLLCVLRREYVRSLWPTRR